jgi:hypothetical protein
MKKAILLFTSAMLMSATLLTGTAHAVTGTGTGDTRNYKYAGVTGGDSGTCGPDWATDKMTRTFKVYVEQARNGSYQVLETFTGGSFTSVQGPSPESCDPPASNNQISAGIKGQFHGYEVLYVSNTNKTGNWDGATDVTCSATCTTSEWIANAFGGAATYSVPDWWFTYKTANAIACAKHWINANYGNSGDIATICN